MAPKAKITREMIVDAGFEIAREAGAEAVNARTVSQRLGCSTQPVMYHFKKIEDLKRAVFEKADEYHTAYIMNIRSDDPMNDIGLNYIRFAVEEKQLFRLLFQSDELPVKNITELIGPDSAAPFLEVLGQEVQVDLDHAQNIFFTLALFAHGCASLLANNSLDYDEDRINRQLSSVFTGAVYAAKAEENQESADQQND